MTEEHEKYRIKRKTQILYAGSDYVVAHNRHLLMRHNCHINIKVVSSFRKIKYIFKYIHKGSDRLLLEASNNRNTVRKGTMQVQGNVIAADNINRKDARLALNELDYALNEWACPR